MRLTRRSRSIPYRVKSGCWWPMPTPSTTRPREMWSSMMTILGKADRVVQRGGDDRRSEAHRRGALQQASADEQRRDQRAAVGLVELGQEDRVEAGTVGRGDLHAQLLEEVGELVAGRLDRQDQAEAHASSPAGKRAVTLARGAPLDQPPRLVGSPPSSPAAASESNADDHPDADRRAVRSRWPGSARPGRDRRPQDAARVAGGPFDARRAHDGAGTHRHPDRPRRGPPSPSPPTSRGCAPAASTRPRCGAPCSPSPTLVGVPRLIAAVPAITEALDDAT